MHYPNHIVFTTIYYPELLWAYRQNLEQFGHLEDTCVWVIGDRKTPSGTPKICGEVSAQGLRTTFLDCAEQDKWGARYPAFYNRLPWDNETRRNVGYLRALEEGCDRLVSIDDDNWPTGDDFIGGHLITGTSWTDTVISEPAGFHNICSYLSFEPARAVFPRGYPFRLRGSANQSELRPPRDDRRIGATAGLWLNEPDVDATTWINGAIRGTRYEGPNVAVLEQATWSPVNTQNTSVIRDLIPAYLCIPMGWDVPGGKIQRYGDIWGGYFLQAVIKGTPWHLAFGHPLVDHRRNPHDYVDDLRHEFWGMVLTDWLVSVLKTDFLPSGVGICDRVRELSEFLLGDGLSKIPVWCPSEMKEFIRWTAGNLAYWVDACAESL